MIKAIAIVLLILSLIPAALANAQPASTQPVAPKPLFRDPIQDGAADPTLIWNSRENKWFMFYTNRRAKTPVSETPGVTWVHGTKIGIAESSDRGATWKYRGTADVDYADDTMTQW